MTVWIQRQLTIAPGGTYPQRPFRMITREICDALPELAEIQVGLLHVFLQHTSASLTINENADPDVLADLKTAFDRLAPESAKYTHTLEGPDDMPAHLKTALLGHSLTIPVGRGRLLLGTWQGIYLCEHRSGRHHRTLILTLSGNNSST